MVRTICWSTKVASGDPFRGTPTVSENIKSYQYLRGKGDFRYTLGIQENAIFTCIYFRSGNATNQSTCPEFDACLMHSALLASGIGRIQSITINLALVYVHISSRHSNFKFAHHFFYLLIVPNGANKNQHQDSYQRETAINLYFFKIGKAKKVNTVSKIRVCM